MDADDADIGGDLHRDDAALVVHLVNHAEVLLALVKASTELDAAWSDAVDAMDDDNIVPADLYERWMRCHRNHRAALEALNVRS